MVRDKFLGLGRYLALGLVVAMALFSFYGCSGDDGAAGPQGPQGVPGVPGDPGDPGPVTTTNESCIVCHGEDSMADVAVAHPDPSNATLAVSNIAVTNSAGAGVVSFNVKQNGTDLTSLLATNVRLYVADLVPALTVDNPESSDYFERWAYERSTTNLALGYIAWTSFTNLGSGDYEIVMTTPLANAVSATDVQRAILRVSNTGADTTVGILDFVIPDDGLTAVEADLPQYQKAYVTVQACQKCHGNPMQGAAHGTENGYADTRACVICHSPLYAPASEPTIGETINASVFFHEIHAAIPVPEFPTRIGGLGYGAVTFPQDVKDCVICHNDGGNDLTGTAAMIDNWKSHPTRLVCSSCHNTIVFDGVTQFVGLDGVTKTHISQGNDTACSGCHPETGSAIAITEAHAITTAAVDVPEFDVAMVINAPANTTHYVAGEVLQVAVTLQSGGVDVDPAFYTTAQGAAGNTSDTALRVASVYIYGPRAKSVPVLATNTITDPNHTFDNVNTFPTQGHSMFVGGTDPLVQTDATGFKYESLPIPADMEAGTYMVRVRIGDYGRVGSGDYHVESIAFQTIQIGTDTAEEKVAGDACVNCHGTGDFEPHNERHVVVFDTDECLSCHDQSGNHAIPLANRVHAVHSANSDGDLYNIKGGARDWEEVTYPQNVIRCVTCHNSGNEAYKTNPFAMPCAGCHVENDNRVIDHMRQNGGPF